MGGSYGSMLLNDHSDLTIGAVAGDGDNIDPQSCMVITPTNDMDEITGFIPPIVLTGLMLWIINKDSTNSIVIKNDTTSDAENRIITKSGSDVTLAPRQTMQLMYMDSGIVGWWEL